MPLSMITVEGLLFALDLEAIEKSYFSFSSKAMFDRIYGVPLGFLGYTPYSGEFANLAYKSR